MRERFDERGDGTTAAAIGAFATIVAALIGGIFLLASTRASNPDPTPPPSLDDNGDRGGDPFDDVFDDLVDEMSATTAVYLNVDNGPTGTTVNVSGEGFRPNERIVLRFHTNQIGTTQANDAGGFANVAVEIPTGFANFAPHQFMVTAVGQSSSRSANAPFTLTG